MSKGESGQVSRRYMGYAGVLLFAVVVFALGGCGGGDDDSSGDAHINTASGSTNEAIPDEREGTPPPPAKNVSLQKAAEKAQCFLRQDLKEEGNKNLPPGSPPPKYKTDPPTSGDHVEPPHQQADGAYLTMPRQLDVVAALNYGRVAIQYAPDISQEDQLEMKGLYDSMYGGVLFFPNDEMNYAVAASAWTNFVGCPGIGKDTLEAVRTFARAMWGRYGNEPADAFPIEGPTPVEPDE